ncbi:MucR family transcriptional regulator, partial [Desulfovibrio sp.]
DNTITCCLCGKAACSLTSRHLANHGINVEEYKYLCGYPSEQKLMSRNFEAKMRRNVQRAQQARKEKRRAENA